MQIGLWGVSLKWECHEKGSLPENKQITQESVFLSWFVNVHYSCGNRESEYTSSWQQDLAAASIQCWLCRHIRCKGDKMVRFCTKVPESCRASAHWIAGLESLARKARRQLHEATDMNLRLQWRSQVWGNSKCGVSAEGCWRYRVESSWEGSCV